MKNGDRKVGKSSGKKLMDLVEDRYIEEAAELDEVSGHMKRKKQFRSKRRMGFAAAAAACRAETC